MRSTVCPPAEQMLNLPISKATGSPTSESNDESDKKLCTIAVPRSHFAPHQNCTCKPTKQEPLRELQTEWQNKANPQLHPKCQKTPARMRKRVPQEPSQQPRQATLCEKHPRQKSALPIAHDNATGKRYGGAGGCIANV
jgi:hypothetical protein